MLHAFIRHLIAAIKGYKRAQLRVRAIGPVRKGQTSAVRDTEPPVVAIAAGNPQIARSVHISGIRIPTLNIAIAKNRPVIVRIGVLNVQPVIRIGPVFQVNICAVVLAQTIVVFLLNAL